MSKTYRQHIGEYSPEEPGYKEDEEDFLEEEKIRHRDVRRNLRHREQIALRNLQRNPLYRIGPGGQGIFETGSSLERDHLSPA